MRPTELRAFLKGEPFRPFDIRLSDGRELDVSHPDFASLAPANWQLVIWQQRGGFDFVDIGSITSLHFGRRNGHGKSKRK